MAGVLKISLLVLLAGLATQSFAQQSELLGLEFAFPEEELNLLSNPPSLGGQQTPSPAPATPTSRFGARIPSPNRPARPFRINRPNRPRQGVPRPRPNPAQARRPAQTANRFARPEVPAPRRPVPSPRRNNPVTRRPVANTPRTRRPITRRPATTTTTTAAPALAPARTSPTPSPFGSFRAVVTYLGTDFILPDGCPLKTCGDFDRVCKRRNFQTEEKFKSCLRGKDAGHMGCVTDVLPTKKTLTIPIYATFCSAYCYEKEYDDVKKLEHCPFEGFKQGDSAQFF